MNERKNINPRFKLCFLFIIAFSTKSFSQQKTYLEKHRPQFHFSPAAKWMNDPNGMVYYGGEYHLFYQYYPDSTVWGPMHWGHAVSKDLIHWQHLPIALYPDSLGYIFSGSVVVDHNNTGGFQEGTEKPLIAIFTYHNSDLEKAGSTVFQNQGIAYSIDKGRTWRKYANNPVVKNKGDRDFRDPKVSWHQASGYWIMTLAAGTEIQFYHSKNLKDWEKTGSFGSKEGNHGGVWECPDLFPLPVDNTGETKWILLVSVGSGAPNGGSGTQYFVGDFDGKTFKNENDPQTVAWLDYGSDDYAGVTWSNTGNRRLFLGWMSNWQYATVVPTQTWRSAMTLPRELSLKKTTKGIRLFAKAVKELEALRGLRYPISTIEKTAACSGLNEILLSFDLEHTTAGDFGIELLNAKGEMLKAGFNKSANQFYIDRTKAGDTAFSGAFAAKHTALRISENKILRLHLYIDRSSIEVFADDGSIVMTDIFFPTEDFKNIKLYRENGRVSLKEGIVFDLKSTWP